MVYKDSFYKVLKIYVWKLKNSFQFLLDPNKSWNGLLSVSIMLAALIISLSSFQSSVRDSRTDLYIAFKERFHEIRKDKPKEKSEEFDPIAINHTKYYRSYWNLAFDEWYATNELFTLNDSVLWNNYYSDAIEDALKHNKYRDSFCYLRSKDKLSFRAEINKFIVALEKLYQKNHDHSLIEYCEGIK